MLFAGTLLSLLWPPGTFKSFDSLTTVRIAALSFAALPNLRSSFFHKKLGMFFASPFSNAPNLPMVSCLCTLLYAVQTIPKEPKGTIIKHLTKKPEMLMLHARRLENVGTCCDSLVLNINYFFSHFLSSTIQLIPLPVETLQGVLRAFPPLVLLKVRVSR